MDDVSAVDRIGRRNKILAAGSVAVALVVHLVLQAGMYLATPGWSFARFRQYYEHDQLGYLAIVKNFSEGQFASFEPDTETGSNTYPRVYYETVGLIARVFHAPPIVAWNVVGLVAQLVLVGVLAAILIVCGRRWWMGLLAPLPFIVGTFAAFIGPGWYTGLASHAVLWGPFGVLHSLNGESVSLIIACLSIFGLGQLWLRPHRRGLRIVGTTVLSLIIGALANVQTYSFIATVYFLAFVLAIWTIASGRNRILAVISVALVPVVFLVGPSVSTVGGQLPTLVFGMLPAVPGVLALIVRTRGIVGIYCAGVVLGAAPQVVGTVVGLATGDPFLVYRVASNSELGVPVGAGLFSGIVLIAPVVAILAAAILRRQALWAAYALGGAVAWLMLATNDRWGANAEPYRLWMDVFFLLAATILPIATVITRGLWNSRTGNGMSADVHISTRGSTPRWVVVAVCALCLGLAAASLGDWARFYRSDIARALMVTDSDRDQAMTRLALTSAEEHPGTLLMVDTCIDPRVLKITSGVPIAYFHLGMAWPTEYKAIGTIIADRQSGVIDFEAARRADATQVLTDSRCDPNWGERYPGQLKSQHHASYTADDGSTSTITLWSMK